MAVKNIVAAIVTLAASAGAGGAYFVAKSPAAPPSPTPSAHATVLVETQEAPAEQGQSVKLEAGGKQQRVEVQRGKSGGAVKVESGGKSAGVSVKRSEDGEDEEVKTGNVKVQRKGGGLNVQVGDLVVDSKNLGGR